VRIWRVGALQTTKPRVNRREDKRWTLGGVGFTLLIFILVIVFDLLAGHPILPT
jgi:hypothetical protein